MCSEVKNTKKHTTQIGTRMYMAPEMKDKDYSLPVDIYALGKWTRIYPNILYILKFYKYGNITNKGIILFELFSIFSSRMDRAIKITNAKEGKFDDGIQAHTGIFMKT